MKKILVIDDDAYISDMLDETLTREGYAVSHAYSGTEALLVLARETPDLILLDLMLPGLNGEEVLPQIRGIPVIVVSAKPDVDHKVSLLLGGAADYVTKPFAVRELLARIAVQFRRQESMQGGQDGPDAEVLRAGGLTLHTDTRTVSAGGGEAKLTRTECAILRILLQNPSQVAAKSVILERIGADTPDCTESSLKMHVSNLRRKLRDISGADCIEAVWGIGFRLRTEPQE